MADEPREVLTWEGFGVAARTANQDGTQTAKVIKAGKPVAVGSSNASLVR